MSDVDKITYPTRKTAVETLGGSPLDIAMSERTISIEQIAVILIRNATQLKNRVITYKRHPSYDSKAQLKADANKLTGQWNLFIQLCGFKEPPIIEWEGKEYDLRQHVTSARLEVAKLYKKNAL